MRAIKYAPKNKPILLINKEHDTKMAGMWNPKNKRWEGRHFGVLGVVVTRWDPKDPIQPTHFVELNK